MRVLDIIAQQEIRRGYFWLIAGIIALIVLLSVIIWLLIQGWYIPAVLIILSNRVIYKTTTVLRKQ